MRIRVACAAFALAGLLSVRCWAQQYTITDLGLGNATGINASGQVSGSRQFSPGVTSGFIYTPGTNSYVNLGTSFFPRAINDLGQVCGNSGNDVLFYDGTFHDVGVPLGGTSPCKAYNLNNAGEITGQVGIGGGVVHGFLYNPANPSNNGYTDLGTLSGVSTDTCYGSSINTAGQVEGDSTVTGGNTHAYIWTNGVMKDLGTFGGPDSSGIHVNDLAHATGTAQTSASGTTPATWISHIFFWDGTTLHDCGALAGDSYANAGGMNNHDVIVGLSILNAAASNTASRAVIYQNGTLANLNTLITPSSGFTLVGGTGINDSGLICANALDSGGQQHALLLTPIATPEPAMLGLAGVTALATIRRRRSS